MERPIDIGRTINRAAKCPKCGKTMIRYGNVCPHCGYDPNKPKINYDIKEPIEIECPNCRTLNEPGNVTCKSCGANFIALEAEKPMDLSSLHSAQKHRKH